MQALARRTKRIVIVATDQELRDPHYYKRLWLAARNMHSRRRWLDVIADTLYNFDGDILNSDGTPWEMPDIDDIFGDPRWFSTWFEVGPDGGPRRNVRDIERLRLIDLYFRIALPAIARHFGR